MTMVMFIGHFMGLPKMNPVVMLSMIMGFPLFLGWVMHFMVGIVFALAYVFLFVQLLKKVHSRIVKGIIFGIAVFIFAQIMMAVMSALLGGMSSPGGDMLLMMAGSVMGHAIYGITVALFVKNG
jgi:uncharacterized membrane protein YagU involved in acid resistance